MAQDTTLLLWSSCSMRLYNRVGALTKSLVELVRLYNAGPHLAVTKSTKFYVSYFSIVLLMGKEFGY